MNIHRNAHFDIYIGRAGQGEDGYYGNPFTAGSRIEDIARFREWFNIRLQNDAIYRRRIEALRGKVLGCHCKPLPCHGDIYVEFLERTVTMSEVIDVFVASAKDAPSEETQACVQRFKGAFPTKAFCFHAAKDVFDRDFKKIGGWGAWAKHIVHGVAYGTAQPLHRAILVPTQTVGKATAQIVQLALDAKKVVMVEVSPGSFKRVISVSKQGEDWKNGWFLTV